MKEVKHTRKEKKETVVHKDKDVDARTSASTAVAWIIILLFILLGFVITLPVEETLSFTSPREKTIVETTIVPDTIQNVNCKLPSYTLVSEDTVNIYGRKIVVRNDQSEDWNFDITVNFTFTNRTLRTLPQQVYEQQKRTISIPAGSTKEITIFPDINTSNYQNVYALITVVPDFKACNIKEISYTKEKVTRETIVEEHKYVIPYTVRKHFWNVLFLKIKESFS